ncbi:hypothetical protein DXG01_000083 [Tephrocybe rancida]|nr:hypothetical protein DXG01_000083 [Tephrocybe rancida]
MSNIFHSRFMATLETETSTGSQTVEELATSLEGVAIEVIQADPSTEKNATPSHPMRIYTRPQILFLSNSPLVQLPPGMPDLKDWFGLCVRLIETERRIEIGMQTKTERGTLEIKKGMKGSDTSVPPLLLSDKYDRDRLALPLSGRTKEREAAPHLSAGPSSRGGQTQIPASSSRRGDTRDAIKKKAGEASEDWRKGIENGRKDRDDRAKSRVRDSSKSRRESSPSRRERDRESEREADDDRRWRDDGKRDERLAARRTDRQGERFREKDVVLEPADRRWVAAEDRESRVKRTGGRDRKSGILADEGKDDRKEREPAWMDTYVPSSPSAGILGGKTGDGELDGIQAWKKERKEKELKEKNDASSATRAAVGTQETAPKPEANGNPLDEIQLFRLLMKQEERKRSDNHEDVPQTNITDSKRSTTVKDHDPVSANGATPRESTPAMPVISNGNTLTPSTQPSPHPEGRSVGTPPLLSLLGAKDNSVSSQTPSDMAQPTFNQLNTTNILPIQEPAPQSPEVFRDTAPQFNPPPGSRLLAFARTAPRSQNVNFNVALNAPPQNLVFQQHEFPQPIPSKADSLRSQPGFSPFEEQNRSSLGLEESRGLAISPDANRLPMGERHGFTPPTEHPQFLDSTSPDGGNGYSANKGSRFAKFFDVKGREGPVATMKAPAGLVSSSPGPGNQRQEHGFNNHGNGPDPRTMDEIYAMLSSSSAQVSKSVLKYVHIKLTNIQGSRGAPLHPNVTPMSSNGGFGLQAQSNLHLLQQQQAQQAQQQHVHTNRLEPLYESRLDDRNFVPDGMVPGLRSAPPRNRDNPPMYPDNVDDMAFNVQQRLPQQQQQRNFEQLYSGGPPSLYGQQQGGRNPGIPLQPNQYRGGPSPLHQQNLVSASQQRLPPGLANLGGRPPHEPSQILGMPGMPNPGLHNPLHLNGSNQQQPFNNFPPGGNLGYGGAPPIRGPHQLQGQGLPMGGHPNNLDLRTASQNQLLAMGGVGALRGNGAFFSGQQVPSGQMSQLLAMRQQQQQQQQQQLPPHMMPHILPPHMQQHHGPNSSQPTQDLMTLLMGGSHRE